MNKEFEALEELRFQVGDITYFTRGLQMTPFKVRDSGLFETIEKDLERKEKLEKAFEIIENHKLLNYVLKNDKCASVYKLTPEEIEILKEMIK